MTTSPGPICAAVPSSSWRRCSSTTWSAAAKRPGAGADLELGDRGAVGAGRGSAVVELAAVFEHDLTRRARVRPEEEELKTIRTASRR